jgi:hypothetical protein
MNRRLAGCLLIASLVPAAHAQELDIDLAKRKAGEAVTVTSPGPTITRVRILNRIPRATYSVAIRSEVKPIPPLPVIPMGGLAAATGCETPLKLATELSTDNVAWTEVLVAKRVAEVRAQLSDCDDPVQREQVEQALQATVKVVEGPFPVPAGTQLVVTVSRANDDGPPLIWVTTVEGPSRGRWLTTYGVSGVPDEDERFYSKATATAGKFTVEQQSVPDGYKAVPSAYFMWLAGSRENRDWAHGPTAGFGIKDDQPAFFVGYSVLYNWNVGLVVGGSLIRETRLNGKYSVGQEVSENLSEDALHVKTFRPRLTVGLVFRFGSSPFGSEQKPAAGGEKAPAK